MPPLLDLPALRTLGQRSAAVSQACSCIAKPLAGWEGWPVSLREAQLEQVGTLVALAREEATLDEYHPDGTSYWSVSAPIAPAYYPYNLCGVWTCRECGRAYLRYNDAGAYHSESRIRALDPALISEAQ